MHAGAGWGWAAHGGPPSRGVLKVEGVLPGRICRDCLCAAREDNVSTCKGEGRERGALVGTAVLGHQAILERPHPFFRQSAFNACDVLVGHAHDFSGPDLTMLRALHLPVCI